MSDSLQAILIALAISLVIVILVALLVTYFTNSESRKYYKPTYDAIRFGNHILARISDTGHDRIKYFVPPNYVNEYYLCRNEILLFYENGKPSAIKLLGARNKYIHNYSFPMTDFYARYWFNKIVKAMNEQETMIRYFTAKETKQLHNFKFLK